MYKAIHAHTGNEIIILSPFWRKKIEQMRELDQQDLLICQGCLQPMRVKAGDLKRPHFAHKHLKACSLGVESPEILNARAVLYHWLEMQFGETVTLEKTIPDVQLPRPIDCWVEASSGPFAYWIIETGIKLEPRLAIKSAFEQRNIPVIWICLSKMLVEEKKEFQSLLLSPTERAFLQTTPYDEMEAASSESGGSLHYLDAESETLTTYRALVLHHRPNWFKGIRRVTNLANLLASRLDGGIIHPGEITRLKMIKEKRKRLEQKRIRFTSQDTAAPPPPLEDPPVYTRQAPTLPQESTGFSTPLPCAICGQITTDYWSIFFDPDGRKLCRRRDCLNQSE